MKSKMLKSSLIGRLAVVLAVFLALAILVGCPPAPPPEVPVEEVTPEEVTPEEVVPPELVGTLRVTGIAGPGGEMLSLHAANFMEAHPGVEVIVEVSPVDEYKPAFPLIAASPDAPDVAWYWVDGRAYQDMVAAGVLLPLDDLYAREGWDKVYPESTLAKYTSPDGHRYAVNTDIVWYPQVYYNKEIFEELGIAPPQVAYTLDEWYEVIDKIRAAGYEPVTAGIKDGWIVGHTHDAILQRMIPQELLDDLYNNWRPGWEPKIHYTGPEWLAANKMLLEWYQRGVFAEGAIGRGYAEGRALFVDGRAAMYQDGSWAVGVLAAEAPDLDFGWMLYPQINPEIEPKFLLYAGNGMMIPKAGRNPDLAKEFLAFMLSREQQIELAKSGLLVPARTDVSPEVMKESLPPLVFEMWEQLEVVGTSTGWDDPVPAVLAERSFILFQEMLTGMRTPESVGEELEKIAEDLRKK